AARNRVRVKVDLGDDIVAQAAPSKLRLIFLGLLTNGIDALANGGGEITVTAQNTNDRVEIDFVDGRSADAPDSFVSRAINNVVAQVSGQIERKQIDSGFRIRLILPPPRPLNTEG
ncbi:MAG: hypothetical protein ABW171_14990, partial [Steroidobacter sp.]